MYVCALPGPKQQQLVSATGGSPKVTFSGWARMALPITSTSIDEVEPSMAITESQCVCMYVCMYQVPGDDNKQLSLSYSGLTNDENV